MDSAPGSELLSRAAEGDRGAFGAFADRYAPSLYDFAARLTRDRDEAFEVVRETFLVALRTARAQPGAADPRAWLFSIARANVLAIVDGAPRAGPMLEGRGLPAETLDQVDASRLDASASFEAAAALAPVAWESAAMLESRQLGMLILHLREGFSAEETAAIFAIRPQNAAVIVPRILRAAEDNAWALLMLRDPSRRCAALAGLLGDTAPEPLSPATRRLISRHMAGCAECAQTRASVPRLLDVFAALAPAELPEADAAALRGGLFDEFAAAPPLLPAAPAVALAQEPGPGRVRVLAAFAGLACVAGLLGGLLLVPASPIALTRDRAANDAPLIIIPANPTPQIIYVTPTPGSPTPTPTPRPSATPTPHGAVASATLPGGGGAVAASPTRTVTSRPTPSPTPTRVPPATPTLTSPTPGGTPQCTPSLSTNVRQVNVSGGSSSFTIFNSFCRAVQYSLDVAAGNSWLHLQQQFGTLQPGDFATVGLTVDRSVLPEGTTAGALLLTWVDGSLTIPVSVTISGGAPIVGPAQATCGPKNQANFFNARVIDDYGVDTVTVTVIAPDGTSTIVPMALSSGDAKAGVWVAEPAGPISSYTVTATDFAGHEGTLPGVCSGSE